jgi:hypothetical protein
MAVIWKATNGELHSNHQVSEYEVTDIVLVNKQREIICGTVEGEIKVCQM